MAWRISFSAKLISVAELAASIEAHGLLQNLQVRSRNVSHRCIDGWEESPTEYLSRAEEMANRALSFDDSEMRAHMLCVTPRFRSLIVVAIPSCQLDPRHCGAGGEVGQPVGGDHRRDRFAVLPSGGYGSPGSPE
jgi:hypothetical protein